MNMRTSKIYNRMTQYFGQSAIREYGEYSDASDFARFCESATDHDIKRVFRLCEQQLATGNQFAPTVGMLSQMGSMMTDDEYYSILDAVRQNHSASDDWRIDWIIRRHSTDIKLCSQMQLRKLVASLYRQACQRGEIQCQRHDFKLITRDTVRDKRVQCADNVLPASIQSVLDRIDNLRCASL